MSQSNMENARGRRVAPGSTARSLSVCSDRSSAMEHPLNGNSSWQSVPSAEGGSTASAAVARQCADQAVGPSVASSRASSVDGRAMLRSARDTPRSARETPVVQTPRSARSGDLMNDCSSLTSLRYMNSSVTADSNRARPGEALSPLKSSRASSLTAGEQSRRSASSSALVPSAGKPSTSSSTFASTRQSQATASASAGSASASSIRSIRQTPESTTRTTFQDPTKVSPKEVAPKKRSKKSCGKGITELSVPWSPAPGTKPMTGVSSSHAHYHAHNSRRARAEAPAGASKHASALRVTKTEASREGSLPPSPTPQATLAAASPVLRPQRIEANSTMQASFQTPFTQELIAASQGHGKKRWMQNKELTS